MVVLGPGEPAFPYHPVLAVELDNVLVLEGSLQPLLGVVASVSFVSSHLDQFIGFLRWVLRDQL